MDNKKIGSFISSLRKQGGMTQKELAEKLNVTDKAVSKWERGVGYPEITIVPLLADELGVSTSELLIGERILTENNKENTKVDIEKTYIIVDDVIEYAKQNHEDKTTRTNSIMLTILSSVFILSIFICMLCNYIIGGTFDWSLYVIGGEVMSWILVAPFFILKNNRIVVSLIGLTVGILPLLLLIQYICPAKNWVLPLALPIVIISLVSLWSSVILFIYTKINRYYLVSFELILFGIVVNLSVNRIVAGFTNDYSNSVMNLLQSGLFAFAAIVVAIVGFSKKVKVKQY